MVKENNGMDFIPKIEKEKMKIEVFSLMKNMHVSNLETPGFKSPMASEDIEQTFSRLIFLHAYYVTELLS